MCYREIHTTFLTISVNLTCVTEKYIQPHNLTCVTEKYIQPHNLTCVTEKCIQPHNLCQSYMCYREIHTTSQSLSILHVLQRNTCNLIHNLCQSYMCYREIHTTLLTISVNLTCVTEGLYKRIDIMT